MSEETAEPQDGTENATPDNGVTNEAVTQNETTLLDSVSDEYKDLVQSKGFKDVNEVIKSYGELESLVGRSLRIPPEDASQEAKEKFYSKLADVEGVIVKPLTDEGKDEFYKKLGRPEKPEEYNFKDIIDEEISKDLPSLSEQIAEFLPVAHEAGLTEDQVKKVLGYQLDSVKGSLEASKSAREANEAMLKEMWGDDYKNRQLAASSAAKLYSEKYPDAMAELEKSTAGNNPVVLNLLAEIGKDLSEKGHAGVPKVQFGLTPDEAKMKISEKKMDSGFMKAYLDQTHLQHKTAVGEMTKLYQIAYNSEE